MSFVDLTSLTTEETWAVKYAKKLANQQIVIENANAVAWNASRPVNTEEIPMRELETDQSMADSLARSGGIVQAVYRLREAKQNLNVPAYMAASLEVQAQVDALLGVEPLLTEEDLASE